MSLAKARRIVAIKRKAETLTTFLKLAVTLGSGYMLYKKFVSEPAAEQALVDQARSQGGIPGAIQQLLSPGVAVLPTNQPNPIVRVTESPDQYATAQNLTSAGVTQLNPGILTQQATASLLTQLDSGMRS